MVDIIDSSQVKGFILGVAGHAIEGASVTVFSNGIASSKTTQSAADGAFSLELEAAKDYALLVSTDGFADQVVPVKSADAGGAITIYTTLIARAAPITIDDSGVLTHTGAAGATVTVDKADFVDDTGNPVTGGIELTITPVDVSNPTEVAAFPGRFAGIPVGEEDPALIVSLGVVEYEFTVNGQPVNLAPDISAEIMIPIYVDTYPGGTGIKVGDSIPLWSLNENTSLWEQESEGIVIASGDSPTGLAFQATVTHFSWWNADVTPPTAQVEITVFGDSAGDAIIFSSVPELTNWGGNSYATINVGETTDRLLIPVGLEVCFSAAITYDDNVGIAFTEEICDTANPDEVVSITLSAPTEGSLNIGTSPKAEEGGIVSIQAQINQPIPPVRFFPLTVETSVKYLVTEGQMPKGLSLLTFDNQARIIGEATDPGSYAFTLTTTDSDGFSDSVMLEYVISVPEVDDIDFSKFTDDALRECVLATGKAKIAELTELVCEEMSIIDASGIEQLTDLEGLFLYGNNLTEIDVSANTDLKNLDLYSNELTTIDVSKNIALVNLSLGNINLTTIDVSKNIALVRLALGNINFTEIDVSKNTELKELDLYDTKLTTIDVSKNIALVKLELSRNNFTTIDVSKNTHLKELDLYENKITTIDVSKNLALVVLILSRNNLTTIDVSKNLILVELELSKNNLTTIDVSKNTGLKRLYLDDNKLTTIDVSKNTDLVYLEIDGNLIPCSEIENIITQFPSVSSADCVN